MTKKFNSNDDVGIVVGIEKANSSLKFSLHTLQHLNNSFDIYYVFFPAGGKKGPYYKSELTLKQSTNGTTII